MMLWVILSQLPIPNWDSIFQLGFAASVAIYLLWHGATFAKNVERNNRLSAITNLTNQAFFLAFTMSARADKRCENSEHEECRRLYAAHAEAIKAIEKQRIELERELGKT